MLACRRTAALAARSWARQHRRAVVAARGARSVDLGTVGTARCFASLPEHTVVGMPALSPTMTHGNIGTWGKQEGDEIAAGDVVCEVETDKATVDFDAQDDSFMAKHLVETGTQDIPVGTPIFVTVDDADSVAAFKDFEAEVVAEEPEVEAASAPAPEPAAPEPVVEEKAAAAVAPAPAPAAAPAPPAPAAPVAAAAPVVEARAAPASSSGATVGLVFKRDWGSGVDSSPLAHRMSAEQKKYVERFGSTLQQPLDL